MLFEKFPKSVETKMPRNMAPAVKRQNSLAQIFEYMTFETMRKIPLPLSEGKGKLKNKLQFTQALSEYFAFDSLNAFDSWITLFPPLAQEMLRDMSLWGYCVLEKYKAKSDKPLITKEKHYYSSWDIQLESWLNLNFASAGLSLNQVVLCLPSALREAIRPWFVSPVEASLDGCAGIIVNNDSIIYNNALEIAGSFPLLCEALSAVMAEEFVPDETYVNLRPFSKKQLSALRAQCGFKQFPPVYEKIPESLDLAARFALCMTKLKPKRPADGQDGVKKLIETFFAAGVNKKDLDDYDSYMWNYFEIHVLTAHLRKKSIGWGHYRGPPPSRKIFFNILTMIAKDGRWFSAESLARYILLNEDMFNFVHFDSEDRLLYKLGSMVIDGVDYKYDYGEAEVWPFAAFRFDLLIRPLFNAYCYLFAALGLLEITQKTPSEPVLTGQGKTKPVSIYDALDAVRVTDFGSWCLGVTDKQPGRIQEKYEAIADKELFLVTVRGFSFERTLYLDAIGEKLGEDRWRISPRSFVSGCADKAEIQERIKKFKRLIDGKPEPHWEALFLRSLERAGFLKQNTVPAAVYYLGDNRSLIEELLNDPALSSCALRAEGRMLVVPDKHRKKFLDLLSEHGVI